jgi:hypothetical protein
MNKRQSFLRFFVLLLAIVAGCFLALRLGAPQAVWRGDASMATSAIALLFVAAVWRIGLSSWRGGDWRTVEFGHLAVRLSVMLGFVGTAIGLSLQAQTLASEGAASLGALSTSLFTTATGGVAAALLEALTYNLEISRDA